MRRGLLLKGVGALVLAVIVIAALMAKPRDFKHRASSASSASAAPASIAIPQGQASQQDVKGLVIALRPTGFIPPTLEVTTGRYLFIVQNRCGIRNLTFRLDRDTGERLTSVNNQRLQWKQEFDLYPGTYLLSVADHPSWHCAIKVNAR